MAEKNDEPLIQLDRVAKSFGDVVAVRSVTLEVPRGQIFGLIGPSGSGKTTTIRLINGVYAPTEGNARVFGLPPHRFGRAAKSRLGYMPQLFVLYPELSVQENLNFVAALYGRPWWRRRQPIKQVLDLVELADARHRQAAKLSGGMQRRLQLAAALLHDPLLLIADEPTAGVDPVLRGKFWEHFRLLQSQGMTLFITTQIVSEVEHCDRVALMSQGEIVALGSPLELRRQAMGGDLLEISFEGPIPVEAYHLDEEVPGSTAYATSPRKLRVVVADAATALPRVLEYLTGREARVASAREYSPPFDEVFTRLVQDHG